MNITLKENETMQDLAEKLGASFELVYDIAPIAFWYENLYENGRIRDIHFSTRMREMLGYKSEDEFPDHLNTLMTFTHPDDVHIMLDGAIDAGTGKSDKYDVQYRIRKADGSYMWCNATGELVKDSAGRTVGMYGAFIDITEEVELQRAQELKLRSEELLNGFSNEYDAVFLGNLTDGSYSVISCKEETGCFFSGTGSLSEALSRYFETVAYPADLQKLKQIQTVFSDSGKMAAIGESLDYEYRANAGNGYYWHRLTLRRISEDELLMGIRNCDEERTARVIDDILMGEYDAIYIADLVRGKIRPARKSRVSPVGVFSGEIDYSPIVLRFADTVAPQYKQDWTNFSDIAYMKQYMSHEDHREYVYELPGTEKTMRRFSADVIERAEGEAAVLLFSFMGIDDARAQTIRLYRQLAEQHALSDGLSREYHTVWLVDSTGQHNMHLYRSTGVATIRDAVQMGLDSPCYDTGIVRYIREYVYEEDQDRVLEETKFETVERKTPEIGTYVVTYRRYNSDRSACDYHQMCYAKAVADDGTASFILAYRDADKMIREQLKREARFAESERVINALTEDFICVNYVEIHDDKSEDTTVSYRTSSLMKELIPGWDKEISFSRKLRMLYEQLVYAPDKETFYKDTRRESILAALEHSDTCFANTRLLIHGDTKYYQIQFTAIREKDSVIGIVAGVRSIDEQMKKELEDQKRLRDALQRAEQESLRNDMLYAASDSGKWSYEISADDAVLSASYSERTAEIGGAVYSGKPMTWIEYVHPQDRDRVLGDFMSAVRDRSGSISYDSSFRVKGKSGKYRWIRSTGKMLRRDDGSGEFFGMSTDFTAQIEEKERQQEQLHALLAEAQEANTKIAEQAAFTTYFLSPYQAAYYLDLNTLSYQVYKRTPKLEERYPVIGNYFDAFSRYIKNEVHPEDRAEFLSIIRPEKIRDLLERQPEYVYLFRRVSDNTEKNYRFRMIRGADKDHAACGVIDVTDELREQQRRILGAVPLSPDVLAKSNIGLWSFELDEGKAPRMYADDTMLGLLGLKERIPPEEIYHAWYDHIDKSSYGLVADAVEKMSAGEHAEVQYPWHYPDGRVIIVRCGGIRNPEYTKGIRIEGVHQDVTETIHFDEEVIERHRNTEIQLQHEQLRSEVLNYMVDHDDDPVELLKNYAERIRVLIDCDQVIYRDLEETRIMVNSPAIENTWSVPIEYCRQCEHFDAHHPMYAGGYTEMDNCQEGWQGIPVYHKCPIKSSLTRIVYCDGVVAGYLAIHYVQNYHHFTDIERSTIEEFTRILSLSLSRYTAKKNAGELNSVKRTLNMMFSLSDQYDPIIIVDPVSGEYDWMMSMASDVNANTSMTVHGDNLYHNIEIDGSSIIHEEDISRYREFYSRENLMKIAETGETQEIENRWFIQTENRYRWKFNKAVRMTDENGKVYVVVGVIDTTEAKEKQEEYAAQKRLMEEQQSLSDGLAREYHTVWLMEGTGAHSLHLFRSTGVKASQDAVQRVLEDPYYDAGILMYIGSYVHEEDRERVTYETKFETVVQETPETGTYVVSYRRYREDRRTYDYHQICYARASAADGTVNYIVAFRDADKIIREQIAQQKQLAEALSMAESASRAKTTFLNNMSHDIRTPMNAIIGYTGLAASHIDNKEQVQEYLTKIGQSSDHLLSLINDVLDMSRIESGKMNIEEKEENLSDIIHMLRDIVQADIHSKQLDFFVDAVDVNDEDVICDKLRLNQALLNILSNSIKYTPAGGTISMRVTETAVKSNGYAQYRFCIKDNGMGIDNEFLETIFDPFTRVKSTTVSGIQGTGLGMAITKNIVDMMGGSIDIQSAPGKGTEVTLVFDFKLQSAPKSPEEIPELKGVRALIADDDSNTCLSICGMLEDIGMLDEWCTSGKEAVIRAGAAYRKGDPFKVYIIDWMMPDMNGIETARRIRKVIGDDAPIIILTAYDWSDIEDEAKEAGVTAFVSKPMFPSDLHRVLNKCLGKETKKESEELIRYDFTGKKVLLVEDNEMNREIAAEILQEDGFTVLAVDDGDVAVRQIEASMPGDFDIILMDVQMPRMDGYEATRQIRALGTELSRVPIIAMTANAFEEDRKAALAAGMDEHIAKPIDIHKLKETLAKFL